MASVMCAAASALMSSAASVQFLNVLMPKADADAFKRAAEKAKQAYEAKFGAIPKS